MKTLTRNDKKTLIRYQRDFEAKDYKPKVSRFTLWMYFHRLNKAAKKYDINLYAEKTTTRDVIKYKWPDDEEVHDYLIMNRASTMVMHPYEAFKRLRESAGDKVICFFFSVPYIHAKLQRKNFYKEAGPCSYCDFTVFRKGTYLIDR